MRKKCKSKLCDRTKERSPTLGKLCATYFRPLVDILLILIKQSDNNMVVHGESCDPGDFRLVFVCLYLSDILSHKTDRVSIKPGQKLRDLQTPIQNQPGANNY